MATTIRTRLVRIGNSQGIRIPKVVLEQLNIDDAIELEIQHDQLIIRPSKAARDGWAAQFEQMAQQGDDTLLDPDPPATQWEESEWQW